MTKEQMEDAAERAGREIGALIGDAMTALIAKRVAEEREACAMLAEREYNLNHGYVRGLPEIHTLIRERGKADA